MGYSTLFGTKSGQSEIDHFHAVQRASYSMAVDRIRKKQYSVNEQYQSIGHSL
jgi:hypothetical protein